MHVASILRQPAPGKTSNEEDVQRGRRVYAVLSSHRRHLRLSAPFYDSFLLRLPKPPADAYTAARRPRGTMCIRLAVLGRRDLRSFRPVLRRRVVIGRAYLLK